MTNLNYIIKQDRTVLMPCCNEVQFEHICINCYEPMGCMFCAFDPYSPHDCMAD